MYAVVRVRGSAIRNHVILDTLKMLNLFAVNNCILVPDNPSYKGMIKKVENFVTWGEVSKELEKQLTKKKGDKTLRLSPPRRGYRSTKQAFPKGALGYRGDKINDLLRRMI